MITENEKAKMKQLEDAIHQMGESLEVDGESPDAALQAAFVGANLATMDALFAIREGTEWRGISDPREIARELLRSNGMGDTE